MRRVLALALALPSLAAATELVNIAHTGYLLSGTEAPASGTLQLHFGLFSSTSGGTADWTAGPCDVVVTSGYYTVLLGGGSGPGACGSGVPATLVGTSFLEVTVAGVVLAPRQAVVAAPRATVADSARAVTIATGAAAGRVLVSDASGAASWSTVGANGIGAGVIADSHVATGAAIATTKVAGPVTSIAGHGLGGLATRSDVTDAQVTGPVSAAKIGGFDTNGKLPSTQVTGLGALATKSTIVEADISGTIAGSKITPAFGSQAITTTGNVTAANLSRGPTAVATGNGTQLVRVRCKMACGGDNTDTNHTAYWVWDGGIYQTSLGGAWGTIAGAAHVPLCNGCAVMCTCRNDIVVPNLAPGF